MSQEEHLGEGFSARELRSAMTHYDLPGASDISELDDMRGDGLDGSGHEVSPHPVIDAMKRYNCLCHCSETWLCNHKPNPACNCGLKGDDLAVDDFGVDAFALDDFGLDDFGEDDEFYSLAADALACGTMSADELMALGWDPFKAVKKTVKAVAKVATAPTKLAMKAVGTATKAAGSVVGKVPIVGGLAKSAITTAGKVTTAALHVNPVQILTNPKGAVQAQINAAKSVATTAAKSLKTAKTLVKSPIVKTVATGAAIVFPPVGIPAAAAIATASAIASATEPHAPAGVQAAAVKIVQNTAKVIAAGKGAAPNSPAAQDAKGAGIALAQIAQAKKALLADRLTTPSVKGAKRLMHEVLPNGRIVPVTL